MNFSITKKNGISGFCYKIMKIVNTHFNIYFHSLVFSSIFCIVLIVKPIIFTIFLEMSNIHREIK